MKRFLLFLFSILFSTIVWCADGDIFTAKTTEGIEMTFKVTDENNKTCQVGTGYFDEPAINLTYTGAITIPSVINGYDVTLISKNAFRNCKLSSVTIPGSVLTIDDYSFFDCVDLVSLTISEGVETIGSNAFAGCLKLPSLYIPSSITSIGFYAFSRCRSISSIVVSENNSLFDSNNNCNAIIETASNLLMAGCVNTYIPNSISSIGDGAFYGCSGLGYIEIPKSVTTIGENAFYACSSLTDIEIPNSIKTIGKGAFKGAAWLTYIEIPNSVTSIDDEVFSGCSSLLTVEIPNSVTSIGKKAFADCYGLTYLEIPNSVTTIGENAFSNCNGVTEVTIGNSVTNIGDGAFNNTDLPSVTIPNSVRSIGDYAFCRYSTISSTSVTVENDLPPTISIHTFSNCDEATLYVPAGSKSTYEATVFWNTFKEIVEFSPPVTTAKKGDANGDGTVDAVDIADILNYMMGKPTSTGKFIVKAADVNGDNTVNTADIVQIVSIISQ